VSKLDSAAWALRGLFQSVAGQPMAGASDPTKLSTRERQRWSRCRSLKEDVQTFADNVPLLGNDLPDAFKDSWASLGEKFDDLQQVLEQCETLAFMIESPERYQPWERNYSDAANAFYTDWYGKLRAMHEAMRQVARLVGTQPPIDGRLRNLPIMPVVPPTIGGPRP